MRNNYLNTPSSFGFTSESSYSPGLVSGRTNFNTNLHKNIEQSFLLDHQRQGEEANQSLGENSSRYSSEKLDYNIQQIYQGLNKIKISKNLKMLLLMIERKLRNTKIISFQFLKVQARKPSLVNPRIRKALISISRLFSSVKRQLMYEAIRKLQGRLRSARGKQIELRGFFGKYLQKQLDTKSILALYLQKWKAAFQSKENTNNVFNQTPKMGTESKKIKFILFLVNNLMEKNIGQAFARLRWRGSNVQRGAKGQTVGVSKKKQADQFGQKMLKNTQKTFQYCSVSQIQAGYAKGIYAISAILRNKVRGYYSFWFYKANQIGKDFQPKSKPYNKRTMLNKSEFQQEAGFEQKDSPRILTGILKHICWLSSKRSEKKLVGKSREKARMKALKGLMLGRERRQGKRLRQKFVCWQNQILRERQQIMKRVKQLQLLKESYIESYK